MSEKSKNTRDDIVVEGRKALDVVNDLIEQGNSRSVVIRQADGTKLVSVSLTLAVAALGAGLLLAFPMMLAVAVVAVIAKIKLEVVSFVDTNSDTVILDEKQKGRLENE